jgi:phage terminase small subunit
MPSMKPSRSPISPSAYKTVYPKSSRHAAETAFGRLMKSATFAARVAHLKAAAADGAVATARQVLEELTKIALANMQDYVGDGFEMRDISELTPGQAAALQEVTVETFVVGAGDDAREVRRVKFKLGALLQLGRHHKLFTDKAEVDVKISLETLIAESYRITK